MCGRVRMTRPAETVAGLYQAHRGDQVELFEAGDYGPGERLLTVAHTEHGPSAELVTWGLPASWLPRGELLRHARAESALAKMTFQDAARHRRCIVPVDAWFERGTRPGVRRGQHQIATRDRAGVALAAIWWQSAGDGPRRLVIVTKQATGAPAGIHHRAPMVVRDDEVNDWIDPRCAPATVRAMFARTSADEGAFEPVALAACANAAKGRTRVASSINAMRKVFRRRRPSLTFGPCITSLIHSSPASRKANRRRSAGVGSPECLSSRPSRESSRCTVEGARGWSTPRSRAAPMRDLTESADCSVLSETSSSATSGGRRRGRPRSARDFGYSASNPPVRYRLSQSRIVSTATRVRRVPGSRARW